ncbi:MAG: F0F1 ATP synthase subunit B [Acetobacteraceae bacterium]|nr:F0F1 ATP synthase subunit B [Acetobacteraceae bacterium]MSP30606.1 F0F1 ATP synthase subunit B [Acetobacteraceae bacterium]
MHDNLPFFANPENWVAIAVVLFLVIFGRKVWSTLTQTLDDRASAVQAELEEAARLRREAEALLQEAQVRRHAALREAQSLLEGAQAEATRVTAAAAAEAEASAKRRERMAMDRIAAAEKAAVDEVRITAAEVATAAARDVISQTLTAEADAKLVEHAIGQLPAALRAA